MSYFSKIKISPTINEISNIITTSKRRPNKLESNRGMEFYNTKTQKLFITQKLLKAKNIKNYSRFASKKPSIAERAFGTMWFIYKTSIFEGKCCLVK